MMKSTVWDEISEQMHFSFIKVHMYLHVLSVDLSVVFPLDLWRRLRVV